ncbi:MAG: protein kinase [Clostridia bacterium]|nr:protein kinase [Clostridia bacterium]
MRDIGKLCLGCMSDNPNGGVCPHCGYDAAHYEVPLHHLRPGTILNGKYYLGRALGEGGFGITYIGWDLNLEMKVAIKEYFPGGFVSRDVSNTDAVTVFSGNAAGAFEIGKNKFVNEAKALAKFDNLPGIVSVKDFFLENGTAYISMEFIEGETLKSFLNRNGGKVSPDTVFAMMRPLMKSLIEVHKSGIIHRDISPDNIMITKDSTVKLLDFGAARDISADGNKSLSIQLKPGYAPEEQYRTHGKQGPWTDVYALCATIYRAITGIAPVESLERLQQDTLAMPSALGVNIDPARESAIMRGMSVFANGRQQTVSELYYQIYTNPGQQYYQQQSGQQYYQQQSGQQYYQQQSGQQSQGKASPAKVSGVKIAIVAGIVALAVAAVSYTVGLLYMMNTKSKDDIIEEIVKKDKEEDAKATEASPTEKVYKSPVFDHVSASSTRGTDYTSGVAVNYFPEYAVDGDYSTAWSSDRFIELTPTITLSSETKQHVSGVRMSNGYFKSETTYVRNRRITKVSVEYEGGSKTQEMSINMYRVMQDIEFDEPVDTTYIKIHVLESYYGDWKDINISEIEVY